MLASLNAREGLRYSSQTTDPQDSATMGSFNVFYRRSERRSSHATKHMPNDAQTYALKKLIYPVTNQDSEDALDRVSLPLLVVRSGFLIG
jgi:hypothetical protein